MESTGNDFITYLSDTVKEYKTKHPLSITDSTPDIKGHIYKLVFNNCHYFMSEEDIKTSFNTYIDDILKENNFTCCEQWTIQHNKVDPALIDYLSAIKQPEQKTQEWYLFRHDHITASNAWKALGTPATKNQLIYEKCIPINIEKYTPTLNENSLTWGHKYEPLSSSVYEFKHNTTIKEFGCIEHPIHTFLAASPDGIVVGENNYGRMIEIKNVVSRVIDGIPKKEYQTQMQLQMEVCNLDECDFVETKFIEYDSIHDFMEDTNSNTNIFLSKDNKQKGIILMFIHDNRFIYKYAPFTITSMEEVDLWIEETKQNTSGEWFKNVYWKLDIFSCVLVKRNKEWFSHAIVLLTDSWNTICIERQSGEFINRAPKKKVKL